MAEIRDNITIETKMKKEDREGTLKSRLLRNSTPLR